MTSVPSSDGSPTSLRDCVICMEAIIENGMFLECAHEFHEGCINQWFDLKKTCPVCRYNHDEASKKPESSSSSAAPVSLAAAPVSPRQEAVQNRRRIRRRSSASRPSSSRSRGSIRRSRSRRR